MANKYGPKIVTDDLLFIVDVTLPKCISPIGCVGFNDAPQLIYNILSPSDTITVNGDIKLGNLTYYTLYGLEYPESSRTPANRDGITLGYNNTSSGLLFIASRDMNYYVYDNDSMSWLNNSYFNGSRSSGITYDTLDGSTGTSEHVQFQTDYANIVSEFPNATHIIIGSHAADKNDDNADTLAILQDLGMPDDHIGTIRPEYILIGKPGLGKGNSYLYVRENNSTAVVHANAGLPIYGNKNNYLEFDGVGDYLSIPRFNGWNPSTSPITYNFWIKVNENSSNKMFMLNGNWATNSRVYFGNISGKWGAGVQTSAWNVNDGGDDIVIGEWNYMSIVFDGTSCRWYRNGNLMITKSYTSFTFDEDLEIGGTSLNSSYFFDMELAVISIHGRALSVSEILRSYNMIKGRFGL